MSVEITAAELDELELLAKCATPIWQRVYLLDSVERADHSAALADYCTPERITALVALARRGAAHENADRIAALSAARKALAAPPLPITEECDRCDGCGWYEGGNGLQTTCEQCGGTGTRLCTVVPS